MTADEENPTEFVARKDGDKILIWVVVDGHEVFHAAPPVQFAKQPIQAAVHTFLGRAWPDVFRDENRGRDGLFK
ncbi:MAG: hypothetical protein HQRvContig01_56 [Haloquadratum phage sp.]|jgi:DNA-binding transcriptional LysR family regulator|nr:MAG: hypothetical protein HQRvContig01_56 [Haloquadratum phage sp.]